MELRADGWSDYELCDCGDGLRLERIGPVVVSRQSAQAVWRPALERVDWERRLHASHYRSDQGPGEWKLHRDVPDSWMISVDAAALEMRLEMRLTPFGHIGMFPEQQAQWEWIARTLATRPGARVLNLFAYTGASTLAAAAGGAEVTHLDAVKGIVAWARANAGHTGLGAAKIRWIIDDAMKFARREARRGREYDAVILDPPTFGRGPQGSVWKIERDLVALLEICEQLLSESPLFVALTAHTPGFTAAVLRNVMLGIRARRGGSFLSGDLVQVVPGSLVELPAGVYCRWTAD